MGRSRAISSSRRALNWARGTGRGMWARTVVTRARTERTPLAWTFSGSTRRTWATVLRSESYKMVPWCMTRPSRMYWELPENFCPPMVMSLRPLT